ncbi:hypothetical protein J7E81_29935 [Bacillus sp. ISL-18]|uniref:YetF domain-containing protein n=1 Tax=Bacillus sp. ISL-18 TaxID=2819118 RepID=UPI001BE61399|nr:YetF domain-containing protein [Bacillus sp. ISL-18]MBT2659348.1 hypothetical protein [Bacillus sp. ISL-18]
MSIFVISYGKLLVDNLRTLRVNVDELEKRLRMSGISTKMFKLGQSRIMANWDIN